jgi:hypothetical protein
VRADWVAGLRLFCTSRAEAPPKTKLARLFLQPAKLQQRTGRWFPNENFSKTLKSRLRLRLSPIVTPMRHSNTSSPRALPPKRPLHPISLLQILPLQPRLQRLLESTVTAHSSTKTTAAAKASRNTIVQLRGFRLWAQLQAPPAQLTGTGQGTPSSLRR